MTEISNFVREQKKKKWAKKRRANKETLTRDATTEESARHFCVVVAMHTIRVSLFCLLCFFLSPRFALLARLLFPHSGTSLMEAEKKPSSVKSWWARSGDGCT